MLILRFYVFEIPSIVDVFFISTTTFLELYERSADITKAIFDD